MDDMSQIIDHLEFLGYEVGLDGKDYTASNPYQFDFLFQTYKGSVVFRIGILSNEHAIANRSQLLEFVNTANRYMKVARATVDSGTDVNFSAFYVGPYDKVIFGRLVELWNKDFNSFTGDHEFSDFLDPVV